MTDECISPLRQRMIEDMSLRHFGEKTQKDYIRAVKNLTIFLGRSPDTATAEDLRLFQLHLTENRVRPPSINFTVTALRFFFTVTLDRADAIKHLTFVAEPRKIPVVLSPEEVARFLEAAPGVKYKAAFSAAYGAGLRVSEVAALKVSAYNSCRNRHCPKCQGAAAKEWLAERESELLPVPYFHLVFSPPAQIADIAYQNKAVIYDLLFKASAETMITIAADPEHLGARIGVLSVLHTWGSALTHHPHVHMIVPGGGIAPDGKRWIACRPDFFLPVRVLSRLFRRLFLQKLAAAHRAGQLQFFGHHAALADPQAFGAYLAPLRNSEWVVYCKRPFGGPEEVLRYLARYTHRVAISNRRLLSADEKSVTFKYKDYRHRGAGPLQDHDAGDRRVHPPLPDARSARWLPPHPLLRPARQRRPCRQHRARPRTARTAMAPDRCHRGRHHQARRAKVARASMPVLRRPHDHHRNLRARLPAQMPPATAGRDQDRHLMMQHLRSPPPKNRSSISLARRPATIVLAPPPHPTALLSRQSTTLDPRARLRSTIVRASRPPPHSPSSPSRLAHIAAPTRSNPHSARGTAAPPSPAISCLGAFRPPAASSASRGRLAGVRKPCMGRLLSRLIFNLFISIRLGTIFSSRPNFDWLPRTVTVKGGRRPSRSDLPLTVTSTATSYVGRTNFSAVRVDKTIPRGARRRARRSRHNLVFGRSVRIAP